MMYRLKKDTYIRNYDGLGYITSTGIFNDRVFNSSGCVFLMALSREFQTIDQLVDKILTQFIDADREIIQTDAIGFYDALAEDGFILKITSEEDTNINEGFSYNSFNPKTIREDFTPLIKRSDNNTQDLLEEHFKNNPHLTSFQIELTSKCNERCQKRNCNRCRFNRY